MANRIFLLENKCYQATSTAKRSQIDESFVHVVGAKIKRAAGFVELFKSAEFRDGVIVCCLSASKAHDEIKAALAAVSEFQPFSTFFAIEFVIDCDEKGFRPDTLLESQWVEQLDKFYDLAVPTSFVAVYKDAPEVQQFQMAAGVSSLLRQLDSLEELRKLGKQVTDLEERVAAAERGL